MALALNHLQRVDMPLNKETKPLYHSRTCSLKFSPIWVSKKRDDKESMIFLTPKPSRKISKKLELLYYYRPSPNWLHDMKRLRIRKKNAISYPKIGLLTASIGMEYNVWRIYFECKFIFMQIVSKAYWYNNRKKKQKKKQRS